MLRAKRCAFVIAVALLFGSSAAVYAQAFGRVVLVVVDDEGEAIPGVKVTVTSPEITNYREEKSTNKKGKVVLSMADATRTYDFLLEKEGFPPMERPIKPQIKTTTNIQVTLSKTVAGQQQADASAAPAPAVYTAAERIFNSGVELLQAGDIPGARAKFVEATEKDPDMGLAYSALAGVYLEEKNYEAALAAVDRFLLSDPENPRGYRFRFEALKGLGRDDEADEMLKKLKKLDGGGDTAKMIFNEGVAASKVGDYKNAKARFVEALELDPTIIQAVGALAIIYFNEGDFGNAATMAERQLVNEPGNVKAMRIRFDSYRALGDTAKAEEAMKALAATDPSALVVEFYNRGVKAFEGGDTDSAIEAFKQVLEFDESHAEAHYRLGISYVSKGNNAAAKTHLEKFIELAPSHPEASVAKDMLSFLS